MKRKIPSPCRESNPRTPIVWPVAYSLCRLSYHGPSNKNSTVDMSTVIFLLSPKVHPLKSAVWKVQCHDVKCICPLQTCDLLQTFQNFYCLKLSRRLNLIIFSRATSRVKLSIDINVSGNIYVPIIKDQMWLIPFDHLTRPTAERILLISKTSLTLCFGATNSLWESL
jgi:hypothetical protein